MRLQIVKEQADEETFQEWREEDYMNKMEFQPISHVCSYSYSCSSWLLNFYGRCYAPQYGYICIELICFIKNKAFIVL